MSELRWVSALLRRRPGRMLAVAAGIAVAVALIASVGSFVSSAKRTMTARSVSQVAVDWQVEAQPGADPSALLDQVNHAAGVATTASVEFATTAGMASSAGGTAQTTGPGVVVGVPADYGRVFSGSIRPIAGAADGVLLPQQAAANLHAAPGSVVRIARPGLEDLAVTVSGIVELPQADSLFQQVGQPSATQPHAPPDNAVLVPLDTWHQAYDQLAAQRPDLVRHQVHVRLDRSLPSDPAAALDAVHGQARHLEVVLAGSGVVGDNLAAALDSARSDALYAQLLFLFLGLPGACIACVLAAVLARVPADARRHEQALLRARGASVATLMRFAVAEGLAVGVIGATAGAATGLLAVRALDAVPARQGVSFDAAWSVGAALAGIGVAIAVLTVPAWRDARRLTVASARRTMPNRWHRPAVVAAGIGLAVFSAWIYDITSRRGYALVFAPEGVPGISVSYWALAGPAALWIAVAILTREASALAVDRGRGVLTYIARPVAGNLASMAAATMKHQRVAIARPLMLIALTVAFAGSTSAFNQTYQQQADIDAKLTNGADVTAASASREGLGLDTGSKLSSVPGVRHVEQLQHRYAYVGTDLQDLYGVRPSTIVRATHLQDAYFAGGTATELIARLDATPDGVLVSAETVHDFQLQLGDPVVLRVQSDQASQPISVPFRYVGVVNEFPTAPRDSFLVANADYISSATGHTGIDVYLLDTAGQSPAAVADAVRGMTGTAAVVTDITSSRTVVGSTLTAVDLEGLSRIELAFALFLICCTTGLALTLGLTERRRSFAIATALGATRRQVGGLAWTESSFVTIAGVICGLVVAWAMSNVLVSVLAGVFDPPPVAPVIPWTYLVAMLACAAIAGVVGTTIAIPRCPPVTDRDVADLVNAIRRHRLLFAVAALIVIAIAVTVGHAVQSGPAAGKTVSTAPASTGSVASGGYPGMPPVVDPANVYSEIGPGHLQPVVVGDIPRVYVPNGQSNTVSVIDPASHTVVATFKTDREPQHVVPSYDLRTLWVLDNQGNTVIPINPADGTPDKPLPADDPYNLYFTPDGSEAIVVAESHDRLDFRDPHTMKLNASLPVPGCDGINHADYSGDGSYLLATCEFAGKVAKIDIVRRKVIGLLAVASFNLSGQPHPDPMRMPDGSSVSSMPQDVRVGPDGKHFYVADMLAGGVFEIDGNAFTATQFIPTGVGAHGITPSRDGKRLYVANRGSTLIDGPPHGPGSVSVIDIASTAVIADWNVPGGGSPDMGNLDATGTQLWLSGRFDSEVYDFDAATGALIARIPVGHGPHGLTVWPQPGRFSLGHTGNMR